MSIKGYEHPWTPGPWTATDEYDYLWIGGDDDNRGFSVSSCDGADMDLVVLAPEMAEAILAWDGTGHDTKLLLVANKLRTIGASDD